MTTKYNGAGQWELDFNEFKLNLLESQITEIQEHNFKTNKTTESVEYLEDKISSLETTVLDLEDEISKLNEEIRALVEDIEQT